MTKAPNKRNVQKAATAEQILKVAKGIFMEQGWEGCTMRKIAKACGKSTGAIFANYQDKAELFTAAMGHRPVTQEQGLQAMRMLRALQVDLDGEHGADHVDKLAAFGVLQREANALLSLVDFPGLPESIPDPDNNPLTTVMVAAIEAPV